MSDFTSRFLLRIAPIILIVLALSCTRNGKHKDLVDLRLQFTNTKSEKVVLQELGVKDIRNLDSAFFDEKGKASFALKVPDPGFYMIRLTDGRFQTLNLAGGENVTLAGDLKKFPSDCRITGSKGSELLKTFFDHSSRNRRMVDSLTEVLHQHQYSEDFYWLSLSIDTIFGKIWNDQKRFEKEFIDKNLTSLASLIVLNYSFGPRPILNEDDEFVYYFKLDTNLRKFYPHNKHVVYHHQRVVDLLRKAGNSTE